MKRKKIILMIISGLVALVALFYGYEVFLWGVHGFSKDYSKIDRCLDSGGRWNYEKHRCEQVDSATMNFENEQYEYFLETWGVFYNDEYREMHHRNPGQFYFKTKKERADYLKELQQIEKELHAFRLAYRKEEGRHVRYKAILKMIFKYKGKEYPLTEEWGYGINSEDAIEAWNNGNHQCDCNRSLFLQEEYGDAFPTLNCGNEIELKAIKVCYEKTHSE